jgi:lipid-binding SYLF domain-containing protein
MEVGGKHAGQMKTLPLFGKRFLCGLLAVILLIGILPHAEADAPNEIERKARGALSRLFRHNRLAAESVDRAYAVLVFPDTKKLALGVGVETATGVLFQQMKALSFYNLSGFSFGLELGIQKFGYAIFFMSEDALDYLYDSRGFEIGSSPSLVIGDGIFSHSASTTNTRPDILTFAFSKTGLMFDVGVHLAKVTEYEPGD